MITESPYWKESRVEKSKGILSSIGFDLYKIEGSDENLDTKSWFNISSERLEVDDSDLWKNMFEAHQERWGEQTITKTFKSKKTRIYPTIGQKETLKIWLNDARLLYNSAVKELQGTSEPSNRYELIKKLVTSKDTQVTDERLLLTMDRTPQKIRAKAVYEACVAHDVSLKKQKSLNPRYVAYERFIKSEEKKHKKLEKSYSRKTKPISEEEYLDQKSYLMDIEILRHELNFIPKFQANTPNLKFRRKKDLYSHIFIAKKGTNVTGSYLNIFKRFNLGDIKMKKPRKGKKKLEINYGFQIRWHRKLDLWYIITCEEVEPEKPSISSKTIIIDPGIRTFLTCLTSDGEIAEFGKNWSLNQKIKDRMLKMDKSHAISKESMKGINS